MCHAVFNQVGLVVSAACLNVSPRGVPASCQTANIVKCFPISETVGAGLKDLVTKDGYGSSEQLGVRPESSNLI